MFAPHVPGESGVGLSEREAGHGEAGGPHASANDEARWVGALKAREAWAWDRLHKVAVDPVFGYVYLRCGRREEAEDVTAEVFAAAVAAIDRFRGDSRVVTWLISIARRKLLDSERRRRRRPEVLETEMGEAEGERALAGALAAASESENPAAVVEQRDELARVRLLVLELPDSQREALLMRCVDGLSLAQIGQVLNRSEDAIKGLLHRARTAVLGQYLAAEAAGTAAQGGETA